MSDTSTSGSTPPEAPAETAGAPSAPIADWGTASGANRGSGLARGKRVSPPASPAPASNSNTANDTYKPSAVQVIKAETEYQNPFAPVNEAPSAPAPEAAPAPVAEAPVAPVVAPPAEAPAPAPIAPAATVVKPTAPAPKAELNILPPAEVKHPAQSWETPAFPYEGNAPASQAAQPPASNAGSPLRSERPVFRPERRSEVPMLEPAPNAAGSAPKGDNRGQGRQFRGGRDGGNRPQQQRGGRPQQQRGDSQQPRDRNRPAGNAPSSTPAASGKSPAKKPGGLFGWVKGLFGTAPEAGKPALPGAQPVQGGGERGPDGNRRRRRRGGRGRSGGAPGAPGGPQGGNQAQSHGQGHPSHGHGGGEHRPQGQGGRRRGGRGRSGGQGGGHRHDGGGSGIPPSA